MEFDHAGFSQEVGRRMQRARKERGITQGELARRIGLPRPSYANIESGRQRVPLDVVWRAGVVLGLTIAELVPEPLPRSDQAPLFPLAAAVKLPSRGLANMTTFGEWRKLPDSAED